MTQSFKKKSFITNVNSTGPADFIFSTFNSISRDERHFPTKDIPNNFRTPFSREFWGLLLSGIKFLKWQRTRQALSRCVDLVPANWYTSVTYWGLFTLRSPLWKTNCGNFSGVQWLRLPKPEYWTGLPCPPPRDHPHPGIESASLCLLHCRWILCH